MQSLTGLLKKRFFSQIMLVLAYASVTAAPVLLRLDMYDASDNHLMYMTFTYNGGGRNSGRTIYMADGTFMRNVAIGYDSLGYRSSEVSLDFNGDTVYVSNYLQSANQLSFSLSDQFAQDLAGDRVAYSDADPLNFALSYQKNGEKAAAVSYSKDAANGQLKRVDIAGTSGSDSYYGVFSYGEAAGVSRTLKNVNTHPQISIQSRASRIDVNFDLRVAGVVRCELLTLSGRRAAVLFNGTVQTGQYTRQFNLNKDAGKLSDAVYLLKVSVDGADVACRRYLYQSSRAGGIQ